MEFAPSPEQREFAASLTDLLRSADSVTVARAWAVGDRAPGQKLWQRLSEQGVTALLVPEADGGLGATLADLTVAFEVLGSELAVGPWIESAAFLPIALTGSERAVLLAGAPATVAAPPHTPYAVDVAASAASYWAAEGQISRARPDPAQPPQRSVDCTRTLTRVTGTEPVPVADLARAHDAATLATAAQLLGAGERVLADTVSYVSARSQYGRVIGSYQALKHQLADVRIGLDFARPLIHGAAVTPSPRSVSAAKIAAAEAAYRAARTGLQLHGAIGYTAEFDLSLWLGRIRALVPAWGTPRYHRQRLADELLADEFLADELLADQSLTEDPMTDESTHREAR